MDLKKPVHAHDCDACQFLGSLGGKDHYLCDLDGQDGALSVLIRHGEGPEYRSLPADIARGLPEYQLSFELARAAGLY